MQERSHAWTVDRDDQSLQGERRPFILQVGGPAFLCERFGQEEKDREQVQQGQSRRDKSRDTVAGTAQQAADSRSDDEAQTKSRTDQSQALRPVAFISDIGNISLGHGDIASGQTIQEAAEKENTDDEGIRRSRGDQLCQSGSNRLSQAEEEKTHAGPGDAKEKNGTAAKPV